MRFQDLIWHHMQRLFEYQIFCHHIGQLIIKHGQLIDKFKEKYQKLITKRRR